MRAALLSLSRRPPRSPRRGLSSAPAATTPDPAACERYERDGLAALSPRRPPLGLRDVAWLRRNETAPPRAPDVEARRGEFSALVDGHELGAPLGAHYTDEEHETWSHLYRKLRPLWDAHASDVYLDNLDDLRHSVGASGGRSLEEGVPDLHDVSAWLSSRSGFILAPATSVIKARSFLTALAMRVFFSCAPVRPRSQLYLAEEPDVVHDVLGHCPLLADGDFADMSQEIGLMSLHADPEELHKLTMLYWHFIEFAVHRSAEGEKVKIVGAAVLSSEGELKHVASSGEASVKPWSAGDAFGAEYDPIVSGYQPVYFATSDVKEAREFVEECIRGGDFKRTPHQMQQLEGLRARFTQPLGPSASSAPAISGRRNFCSMPRGSDEGDSFEDGPGAKDWDEFRENGKKMIDFIADYYESIEKHPVRSQMKPGYLKDRLPTSAPETPESLDAVLRDVEEKIHPGMTHWQHPKFFAYFPTAVSPHSLLGDMLSGMYSVVAFSWVASPAATELETITMDWLAKMINLPECFLSGGKGGGVVQGSASEATLVALVSARARALKELKPNDESEESFLARAVCYSSDHAHMSIKKALKIAGFNVDRLHTLPTGPETAYAATGEALAARIAEDKRMGLVPVFFCANVGTTSTCAVDPLDEIGFVCRDHNIYLHLDAAYAGSAAICPEHQHILKGAELVDSIAFNPHKWMLVNFDFCAMWVKDMGPTVEALSITPAYLRSKEHDAGLVLDYRDLQVPLGRRFRSLKLWTTLRMYGAEKLRTHIRKGVAQGDAFAAKVVADERFELSAPPNLGLVCFRLKGSNELNKQLLENINATGKTFLIGTELGDSFVLRFVGGNLMTTMGDMEDLWYIIQEEVEKLL